MRNTLFNKRLMIPAFFLIAIIAVSLNCQKKDSTDTPDDLHDTLDGDPLSYFGPLKVNGNRITDLNGNPVQLRGMSFFWSQWMGKYYNSDCVEWLKDDWHCNIVRAALAVEAGGYLTDPEAEKKKICDVVDAAIKHGIYVIIDWHDHHATDHMKEAKNFFAEMAQKYGDKPNVIYETFNEPLQISWSSLIKPYHKAIIDTIRYYDPDNLIICGTPTWSQDVDVAANDPLSGINIGYALHFYPGTHKQSLRDKAQTALNKGVALMVTEFGTTNSTGDGELFLAETKTWFNFLDENKISWCNWSVADKAEASAALLPGSPAAGGWTNSQLTASGTFIRSVIREKNLWFQ